MGENVRNACSGALQSVGLLLDVQKKNFAPYINYTDSIAAAQTLSYLLKNPEEFIWNGKSFVRPREPFFFSLHTF